MKFNSQTTFKGNKITNVVDKPVLHKRGKQWITVGLSALILAGFGAVSSGMLNANAASINPATTPTTTKVQQPTNKTQPQSSATKPQTNNTNTNSKGNSSASSVSPASSATSAKSNNTSSANSNISSNASNTTSSASNNNVVTPQSMGSNNTSATSNANSTSTEKPFSASTSSNNTVATSSTNSTDSSALASASTYNAIQGLSNEVYSDSVSVADLTQASAQNTKQASKLMSRLKTDMRNLSNTNLNNANKLPNFNNDVINVDTDANKPKHSEYTHINRNNRKPRITKKSQKLQFKPYYVYSPTNIILHGLDGTTKVNKNRGFTGKILRPTKIGKREAFLIEWNSKFYIVDANQVRNVYIQPKEFNKVSHGVIPHATVKVIKDVNIYNSVHYTKKTNRGLLKRGSTVSVVGTKSFGRKGYKRTRLVLSNGDIITANKNFVRFIK